MTSNKIKLFGFSIVIIIFMLFNASADTNSAKNIGACITFNPTVIVCDDSKVSFSRAKKAVEFWKKLGYSFEEIIYKKDNSSCSDEPNYGEIVIMKPSDDYDPKFLGITKRTAAKKYDVNIIVYSKIYMPKSEVGKERVLEHEIGHAIGWNHFEKKYHIMHEDWASGGWGNLGIERDTYLRVCDF